MSGFGSVSGNPIFHSKITQDAGAGAITSFGAGFVSDNDCKAPTISNINGVIVTKLFIDLAGNTSKNDVDDVIGDSGGGDAYVYRHSNAISGFLESITVTCTETPTTGADDIDFRLSTDSDLAYDSDASGEISLIISGAAWEIGVSKMLSDGANPMAMAAGNFNSLYLYLCSGEAVAGEYGAGKFIVTIVGNETF